ncbi:hypothetical protein ABZ712_17445 [Streptomyces sp. NPDC006906]|uniref:hypothetical protein n=1 Tax=unclassified Streptomyces TaxID=2593676 RepID=UPI0033EF5756
MPVTLTAWLVGNSSRFEGFADAPDPQQASSPTTAVATDSAAICGCVPLLLSGDGGSAALQALADGGVLLGPHFGEAANSASTQASMLMHFNDKAGDDAIPKLRNMVELLRRYGS